MSTFSSHATQTRITDFHKAEEDYIRFCDVIKNGNGEGEAEVRKC